MTRRIYPGYAYSEAPREKCFWQDSAPGLATACPPLRGEERAEVGIIGGGVTGLNAALHLAEAGISCVLLDARWPGWGASARNGGFVCLGGARASPARHRRYGPGALAAWEAQERRAVDHVSDLMSRLGIDADRHSEGETLLAHHPRAMARLRREAAADPALRLTEGEDLRDAGMGGGFHGALTRPEGFAIDPGKYCEGLVRAARAAGARLFRDAPVEAIARERSGYLLRGPRGRVACRKLIVATNGYSSDDLPDWMRARYLPTQSSVMVTRPLSDDEIAAQGWSSGQMSYDTRRLLHYFRLMPNRRFLFGMRGGLTASPRSEAAIHAIVRRDFDAMFPQWRGVETTHSWSGFVCISPSLAPYCGPIPEMPGAFAGFGYHGNGVAMGSLTGALLADLAGGRPPRRAIPPIMAAPPPRFPLGRFRRALMPPTYAAAALRDRFAL